MYGYGQISRAAFAETHQVVVLYQDSFSHHFVLVPRRPSPSIPRRGRCGDGTGAVLIVPPLHLLSQVEHILRELEEEHRQSILARLAAMGRDVPPGVDPLDLSQDPDLLSEDDSSDAGSDSSESDGPPVHLSCKGRPQTSTTWSQAIV